MFKVGDKVVPNGFRANGDKHYSGTDPKMIEWGDESKVLTVNDSDENGLICATDGSDEFYYHPSELRIATGKEIEALNETKEQKFEFEFDFDNYFYVLELNDSKRFITACKCPDGYIFGLNNEDNPDYINQDDIKKIIAIIPKR